MAEDGAVSRDHVIAALKASGTSVTVAGEQVTLVKDGVPEVYQLPDQVGRKMLHHLARKYDVRIEWFFHPELVCAAPQATQ